MIPVLKHLKTLGFSGMLGAGVLGLLYVRFPALFGNPPETEIQTICALGGLTGVGIHQVLRPVFEFMGYHAKWMQLAALNRLGVTPEDQKAKLTRDLTEWFFQPPDEEKQRRTNGLTKIRKRRRDRKGKEETPTSQK